MRIKFQKSIFVIAFIILALSCLISPAFAISDLRYSAYHNMTVEEIQRIVDETSGTQIDRFGFILEDNPNALAAFGKIPDKAKGVEAYEYWLQMDNISFAMATDESLNQYRYEYGGLIIGQGMQCVCYISVMVLDERADEFTEEDMLFVKEVADKYAALEGIEDCPIVFFKSKMVPSFLTDEQLVSLWASGYDGLRIYDGLENLTEMAESFGYIINEDGVPVLNSSNAGFDDYGRPSFTKGSFSFSNFIKSLFGSSDDEYLTEVQPGTVVDSNFSTEKIRPLVGGIMVATNTSGATIGYAAKDINNSSSRGIVTVAHVLHFDLNNTLYQPRQVIGNTNTLGNVTKMSQEADCIFIPTDPSEVKAAIYTGEGDNHLLDVIGYEGALSHGIPVEKSGAVSGNTAGSYYGTRYNQTFTVKNGTINYTMNYVGVIKEVSNNSFSVPGDSGGPVYLVTNATINGTPKQAAVLLGILEGGDGNGTVYYVPCTEIRDELGVVPLTVNDR